jgi:DNA-binding Lrp family transcriptional regulator
MKESNNLKFEFRKLFDEGKSETEAHKELSKTYNFYTISEKAVTSWYQKFRSEDINLIDKKAAKSEKKLTDERLIDIVKENPSHSLEKLAILAGVSIPTMSKRIRQLKNEYGDACYNKKDNIKIPDESMIELVKKNPLLNVEELANLAGVSQSTISRRIRQIDSNGDGIGYVKKLYRPNGCNMATPKLTDEYLINLIDENPMHNILELSKLAKVPRHTLQIQIKKLEQSGKSVNYVRKNRSKFSDEFLINLVNKNPSLTLQELSKILDTSTTTVNTRLKKINSNGEKLNRTNKKGAVKPKFNDEFLIDLINKNPELCMTELAKLAGVSQPTISRRLKQINSTEERVVYIKKRHFKEKPNINVKLESKPMKNSN